MLYNIKVVHLHCVFHGIRFKVNKDWVSVIDTLLFFMTKRQPLICGVAVYLLVSYVGRYAEGNDNDYQDCEGDVDDFLTDFLFVKDAWF